MAIQSRPNRDTNAAAEAFIGGTPPAAQRSRKTPIAMRFDPGLLARIDEAARCAGISRNAWVSYQCAKALEAE